MKGLLCRLGLHSWELGAVVVSRKGSYVIKECKRCGKAEDAWRWRDPIFAEAIPSVFYLEKQLERAEEKGA
jgi:hypothetical protein